MFERFEVTLKLRLVISIDNDGKELYAVLGLYDGKGTVTAKQPYFRCELTDPQLIPQLAQWLRWLAIRLPEEEV